MKLKIYRQPKGAGHSAVYAVAHLTGCTLANSLAVFGINQKQKAARRSGSAQMQQALERLGYTCPARRQLITCYTQLPPCCLLSITLIRPGTGQHGQRHWVAHRDGLIICSQAGLFHNLDAYLQHHGALATAYLDVKKL